VQAQAWPLIAEGRHVLAVAPTGSGKTLTAFLVAISRFAEGIYKPEDLSVLYVSPLKALNEDIRRNLLAPLEALSAFFAKDGDEFPCIRVGVRSGDTPQAERRRFLAQPPAILAVTPESLAILLLNPRARAALTKVRCVVLDEVHAVLGSKRGVFLACQIERLAMCAGEFQRIALSATVRPPEAAAFFTGGLRRTGGASYERRPVCIVHPAAEKRTEFTVDFPAAEDPAGGAETKPGGGLSPRYAAIIQTIAGRIQANRSTLVFTDSRRRAERIALLLNERFGKPVAFAHHGSLSKEVRRAVETRLAEGKLPCVAATGSLELGIDIGAIDEVILAGSPGQASAAVQRTGRSGHGVGRTSRGLLLPFHGLDLLAGAALAGALAAGEIEECRAVENPLDVLAQIILALCAEAPRNIDGLYSLLRGFSPFYKLPRPSYDRVIAMLTGRYNTARLRGLKTLLYHDAQTGELHAPEGILRLLYISGGVIASRGSYSLRLADGTKIGDLDEEFVWERRPGDSFSFGTRAWRITAIGQEAVEVVPLDTGAAYIPFWKAEGVFRSTVLSRRIRETLDAAGSAGCAIQAWDRSSLTDAATRELDRFLQAQIKAMGGLPLPGEASIAVELTRDPGRSGELTAALLHTFRGGAVNYPLAMALGRYLEKTLGCRVETIADDNAVLVLLSRLTGKNPEHIIRAALTALGSRKLRHTCLRSRLESSGLFGAAFREAAERAMILPKTSFTKRTPLWIMRQRAKRLFDLVSSYTDFPLIAEAWRDCLADQFDMAGFDEFLEAAAGGLIAVHFFQTETPSPFARDMVWKETNRFMYEYDERPELRASSVADSVIEEALGDGRKRPVLAAALVADFASRLRRELPGWAPETERELAEWVKERVAIPQGQWQTLLQNCGPQLREAWNADNSLKGKLRELQSGGAETVLVHRENAAAWKEEPLSFLGEWLRHEGPVSLRRIAGVFSAAIIEARAAAEELAAAGEVVLNVAVESAEDGGADLVCDRENLEILLRLSRKKSRAEVKPLPVMSLVPYLALRQNILAAGETPWQTLACFSAPARLWETEIFPIRCAAPGPPEGAYNPKTLDAELEEGRLLWYGAGEGRCGFCAPEDLDLVLPDRDEDPRFAAEAGTFRDFWELKDACGLDMEACRQAIWEAAWKGRLSSDSWAPVRKGLLTGFFSEKKAAGLPGVLPGEYEALPPYRGRRVPRALRDRWKQGAPVPGRWFSLASGCAEALDPLDEEELDRDRVRLLLRRWGVLCRPLLEREEPALSWGRLLPAIRRLELTGELTAGRFFEGIASLQFTSAAIAAELRAADAENRVYWMNACDPASPAGLDAEGLDPRLPSRLAANRLCFRGARLLAVSCRGGKDLNLYLAPDDPALPEVLAGFTAPRGRVFMPQRKIIVETINAEPAAASPCAAILKDMGFLTERKRLILW
jgi:ATP-dependent Lhr-like helicase